MDTTSSKAPETTRPFRISHEHRVIILPYNEEARAVVPEDVGKVYTRKGKKFLICRHAHDTTKLLRNVGYRVPSPIYNQYDWNDTIPFDSQKTTAAAMAMNPRLYVLNQMGTGKTRAALFAYDYLRRIGKARKMIIVAPLSTLTTVWAKEAFQYFPHLEVRVLHGSREKRIQMARAGDFDIAVINHDGVKVLCDTVRSGRKKGLRMLPEIFPREEFNVVVLDELATYRNATTDRWKSANVLVAGRDWVWGMTGGPIPRAPTDAWAQARLLTPETVSWSFKSFREKTMFQASQFTWTPRKGALKHVQAALTPSVRFTREQCLDLPPTTYSEREAPLTKEQQRAYKQMVEKLTIQHANGKITAANAGVQMGKLLQVCCIAEGTEVLSDVGWLPIERVSAQRHVWDGEEWVSQDGCVFRGEKPVINCGGIAMTPDHLCWTTTGWQRADGESSERFNWAPVRLPNGYPPSRDQHRQTEESTLAVPMRLRQPSHAGKSVPAHETPSVPTALRLPARQQDPRKVANSPASYLGGHETALQQPEKQRLSQLGRARHYCVRQMERLVRSIRRGYGAILPARIVVGAEGQQWTLQSRELPLGNLGGTKQQPQGQHCSNHSERQADAGAGSKRVRAEAGHIACQADPVWLGPGARTYDLTNCGPRNRFVVRGQDGTPRIVHNCGFAYDHDGGFISLDHTPRINLVKEVIEEANAKVIVFVPFKRAMRLLEDGLKGHCTTASISGDTPKRERDEIFTLFQDSINPHVIIAHPKVASHGLTLTAADTIIWYAPYPDLDVYDQACARIPRPGQRNHTHIVHLIGTTVEKRITTTLRNRGNLQGSLLDTFENLTNQKDNYKLAA